jgi:hypothetical protein
MHRASTSRSKQPYSGSRLERVLQLTSGAIAFAAGAAAIGAKAGDVGMFGAAVLGALISVGLNLRSQHR